MQSENLAAARSPARDGLDEENICQWFVVAAVMANVSLLFTDSFGVDLNYWRNWIGQFQTGGYADFRGDYPPVYLHWFYILGILTDLFDFDLENNLLLKTLTVAPAIIAHALFVRLTHKLLCLYEAGLAHKLMVLALTAFNPAILFDGPIWGQVDIVPSTMVAYALYFTLRGRLAYLSLPLYMLALVTKFQMIAFAPVFGIIFVRQMPRSILPAIASVFVFFLAFLPFIIAGNFIGAFKSAYINTLGQYAYSTMNAANLWLLLSKNLWPDSAIIFDLSVPSSVATFLSIKFVGIVIFAVFCVTIFCRGLVRDASSEFLLEGKKHFPLLYYAVLCAAAFFYFLPGMHERYSMPAVCMALLVAASNPKVMIYALGFTAAALLNIGQVFASQASVILHVSAILFSLTFAGLVVETLGYDWRSRIRGKIAKLPRFYPEYSVVILLACIFAWSGFKLATADRYQLLQNETWLTDLAPLRVNQAWGRLKVNRAVSGSKLSVDGTVYMHGLGTHASSSITYSLDKAYSVFHFQVGIDDKPNGGDVEYLVYGDGSLLWRSGRVVPKTVSPVVEVDVSGVNRLELKVDELQDKYSDHANWLNPVLVRP